MKGVKVTPQEIVQYLSAENMAKMSAAQVQEEIGDRLSLQGHSPEHAPEETKAVHKAAK